VNTQPGYLKRIRNKLRLRQRAWGLWYRFVRRAGFLNVDRIEGVKDEALGWENFLKDPGRYWLLSEYQTRMNPQLELQDELKALIQAPLGSVVRILDVGAGPLTHVGKRWEGRELQLFPVDPLAEEYKAIWKRLNLRPPVFTELADGEKLLESFPKNHFDLACAHNALDHAENPLLAIQQMFAVVKPGGYVYLMHFANEGVREGYKGEHQWNFNIKHGDVTLDDGRKVHYSLAAEFKGKGSLECEFQKRYNTKCVIARLEKLEPT
jgi:SAM-dependent methyltransferase